MSLKVNRMGRNVLRAVPHGGGREELAKYPHVPPFFSACAFAKKRPDPSNGGLRLPSTEDGPRSFDHPHAFSACRGVTLVGAMYGRLSDPGNISVGLFVTWGHASAQQLKRVLTDSDEGSMHLVNYVDEVPQQCDLSRASDNAPHVPIAATSAAPTFNGKL